ncbi:MAG: DUF1549 and DUF1553 domain-containing protein, partial [Verrucomicrobiales bacterium]|nr:DUF1549 and DUF1553 domain-containing protein [Verrucomicrobiales bacterium]
ARFVCCDALRLCRNGALVSLMVNAAAGTVEHWSFQPLAPVEPPSVRDSSWVRTPVDRFILSRLESAGLKPSVPATREQLIRRATLGLIGLPAPPQEVDEFLKDRSADAYERLIDRLLGSPHYGERWGRHWLDLARYAESDGFEHDAIRPHSWRYRDYVIQAFNQDKPYDRFVREQLAGDELWPDEAAALVATGFNLLGPDMVDSSDQIQRRLNTLNDMTDTAASVFLGLTLGCARCHDHKSEPFTQRDYFGWQAFFAPAEFRRERPIAPPAERAAHERAMAEYNTRTRAQRKQIEEIEAPYRHKLFQEKLAKLSADAQAAHRTPKEHRTMEQEATVQETLPQVKVTDADVTQSLSSVEKERRALCEAELRQILKPPPLPMAMVLQNTNGPLPRTSVLFRGDYNNPREEVEPDIPAVLQASKPSAFRPPESRLRRSALAGWIASSENPLTARVMVNRIWQHHFGAALVATPNDFGTRGQAPTHPDLLDWLAGEFVRAGWSVKHMQKLILLSAAYQQSSRAAPESLARDPDNKLFSRQNHLRLEGEVIRDSLLAISGRLNPQMGGPSVLPPIPTDLVKTARNWTASTNSADHHRRSIYVFARRNLRFPFFEAFDAPDSNASCPERGHSTTAPQSLTLLNSEEMMTAAEATAERVGQQTASTRSQIELAYRLVLGRDPTPRDLALATDFLRGAPMKELCRALFNLNAFVYAD